MKLDNRLSLGGDFAAMFMNTGNRKSAILDAENKRTESVSPAVSLHPHMTQLDKTDICAGGIYNDRETVWYCEETAWECEQ